MSVLVKGMEKPEHCGYCRFRYDGICHALQRTHYSIDECPLIGIDEDVVKSQPSAERKGKWINHRNDGGHNIADCSECGSAIQWFDDDEKPRFCCMCGSRNKEEEKE